MKRFYREYHDNEGMVKFKASIESSDLLVIIEPCDTVENMLEFSLGIIGSIRSGIKTHINAYPQFFLTSLEPLQVPIEYGDDLMLTDAANLIDEKALIQSMYIESAKAGVGPWQLLQVLLLNIWDRLY